MAIPTVTEAVVAHKKDQAELMWNVLRGFCRECSALSDMVNKELDKDYHLEFQGKDTCNLVGMMLNAASAELNLRILKAIFEAQERN